MLHGVKRDAIDGKHKTLDVDMIFFFQMNNIIKLEK